VSRFVIGGRDMSAEGQKCDSGDKLPEGGDGRYVGKASSSLNDGKVVDFGSLF
jgi:hypothetical protein